MAKLPQERSDALDGSIMSKDEFTFELAVQFAKNGSSLDLVTQQLLSGLTNEERLALLDGDVPFWDGLRQFKLERYNFRPIVHGSVSRLAIPGIRFTDGPRGIVVGQSTAFPVSMARGATWDIALEEKIGLAIGIEGRAQGANYYGGVCINLPRHPAWGRIQETYSEDPLLLGEFGLALTRGVQNHLMACAKHYALNSMENARFRVDVDVDDAALHEVYLPHFRRVVEGGVASVMSSYNSVRGEWAGQNKELLIDILREKWNFDGFVISDFIFGLRDPVLSLKNGLDIEAPFSQQRASTLGQAIDNGSLQWSNVDRSCFRILRKQIEHETKLKDPVPSRDVVFCDEHRNLAREAAARGMVLLKNDNVSHGPLLPLKLSRYKKVAVIGRLANTHNTGDKGSSAVFPPHVVTPYDGIKQALPEHEVVLDDSESVDRVHSIASSADLVICVVGYDAADEGEHAVPSFAKDQTLAQLLPAPANELDQSTAKALMQDKPSSQHESGDSDFGIGAGGDRQSLKLRPSDAAVIARAADANTNIVVCIVAAGAVMMEEWVDRVPALLMTWYSGVEGGHALADVLLGKVDASGRLPFSIPCSQAHLPHFDIEATKITYDRWFGQRLLDKLGVKARFPLGYGLSYTAFEIADFTIDSTIRTRAEFFLAHATVTNTGERPGRFIAQVYGVPGLHDFPARVLLGFHTVDLHAGECRRIWIQASARPLQRWVKGAFVLPDKEVLVELSPFAGAPAYRSISIRLREG